MTAYLVADNLRCSGFANPRMPVRFKRTQRRTTFRCIS
jgi:hypothetical protein